MCGGCCATDFSIAVSRVVILKARLTEEDTHTRTQIIYRSVFESLMKLQVLLIHTLSAATWASGVFFVSFSAAAISYHGNHTSTELVLILFLLPLPSTELVLIFADCCSRSDEGSRWS